MDKTEKMKLLVSDFEKLIQDIDDISTLGDNSVVRRIKNRLYDTLSPIASEYNVDIHAPLRRCGPDRDPILSLSDVVDEFQADDRRRSVFIDPEEAVIANLIDYYSGRIKSIEFRNPNKSIDFDALKEKTIEHMRGVYPVVTINHELARDNAEVVFLLRQLADEIESKSNAVSIQKKCSRRTESLGTRWSNNGRTLEKGYRIIEKCCSKDPCCGNETCGEQSVGGGWDVIWTDGDTSTPPPVIPDDFTPEPWSNRQPFFDDQNAGTLVSDWGWRNLSGGTDFHGGIDIAVPAGTFVNSINSGEVVAIRNTGHNAGIVIRSGNTTYTYWHVTPDSSLNEGDVVNPGTRIGTIASGGREHLHYAHHQPPGGDTAQRNDENSVNPMP